MVAEFLIPTLVLPLRIMLGILFLLHGFPKLKNPESTATFLMKLKMPLPKLSAIIMAILEFFGGIALLIGFSTRIFASLLAIDMLILTYLKIHMKKKHSEKYTYDLILTTALLILIILGSSSLSIDHMFGWLLG